MHTLLAFWRSAIGKKVVMAVTGIIGIGFVIVHAAGNMMAFRGVEAMNGYAAMLHGPLGELLWILRIILILAVILHVIAAYQLTQMSHAARPEGYTKREPQVSTLASRLMRWGGVLLLVFIVFHILHFTIGTVDPGHAFVHAAPFGNIVASFHIWWVSLFYIVAMIFLGLHLYHGAWSSFRTIGAKQRSANPLHRNIAAVIAVLVWAAFTSLPVGVMLGIIR